MTEPFPNADIIRVVSTAKNTEPRDDIVECCCMCGKDIETMVFKGTGVCGDQCNKKRAGVEQEVRALAP